MDASVLKKMLVLVRSFWVKIFFQQNLSCNDGQLINPVPVLSLTSTKISFVGTLQLLFWGSNLI